MQRERKKRDYETEIQKENRLEESRDTTEQNCMDCKTYSFLILLSKLISIPSMLYISIYLFEERVPQLVFYKNPITPCVMTLCNDNT